MLIALELKSLINKQLELGSYEILSFAALEPL